MSGDEQARNAAQLLYGAFRGVLSTLSMEHPGYPFGSVVPYVLAQDGTPLMLLSHLSQHTKNLDGEPRCGLTVVDPGEGDVQQLARLSAIGDIEALTATAAQARYFDYFPHSRMYFEQLGFRFYRFRPIRVHWNGGFATARWFSPDRLMRPNPLDPATQAGIVRHMNEDHGDALRHYLGARAEPAAAVQMVGIDADGIDLRVDDRLCRVPLPTPIESPEQARAALIELARTRAGS